MAFPFSGSILLDLLLFLLSCYFYYCLVHWGRLAHIPGPPLWSWTVLPLFRAHYHGTIYDVFGDLNKKYGPLVRIGPNMLLVSDPDELRKMSAARSPYTRAGWYVAMRVLPGVENVLSTRDEGDHEERKRKMAAAYSGKENRNLEKDVDECVKDLVDLIENRYAGEAEEDVKEVRRMDLARKLQYFTSDVMSKLAFDGKFCDLKDDKDNFGYIEEVETLYPNMFCTCVVPSLLWVLTFAGIARVLGPNVKSKFGFGRILAITREHVAQRFDTEGKMKAEGGGKDMLASFLRHGLSREEAEQEGVLQLTAGTDTTATGLRAILLCVASNPLVQVKLVEEIERAVKEGKVLSSSPSSKGIISDEQARKLPYLQACIKEGLRWFPPVAGLLAKEPPELGDVVCGFPVPAGTSIGYSAKAVHHSKDLFGPDEETFRPERWLLASEGGDETDEEKIKEMEKNNELLFGFGKYQCLGKQVALIELNKVVFEVVRRFDVTVLEKEKPWSTRCFGIHLQKDLWVGMRRRKVAA